MLFRANIELTLTDNMKWTLRIWARSSFSMLSYETIDKARRANANKEKEKKKELSLKKANTRKRGDDVDDPQMQSVPTPETPQVTTVITHWVAGSKSFANIVRTIMVNTGPTTLMSVSLKIRPTG
jgi:hypothetical protein